MKTPDSSSRRGVSKGIAFQFRSALIITAGVVAFGIRTEAAIIRVDFTSKVTEVQNGGAFGASPNVGDLVTGFFTYDTTAPDTNPGDPMYGYYSTGQISVTVDGTLFENDWLPLDTVRHLDPPDDVFFITAGGGIAGDNILENGVSVGPGSIVFWFIPPDGSLTSDALPDPQTFSLFDVNRFFVSEQVGTRLIEFDDVQTMEAHVIPEPTTFTLLGLGSLALVMARRRRSNGGSGAKGA